MDWFNDEEPDIYVAYLKERVRMKHESSQHQIALRNLKMTGAGFIEMFDEACEEQEFERGQIPIAWFALTRLLGPIELDQFVALALWKIARGEDPLAVLEVDAFAEELVRTRRAFERGRANAHKSKKYARGIQSAVDQALVDSPMASARTIWDGFPGELEAVEVDGFEIYRDGDELIQRDAYTGKERVIKFRTFQDYLKRGRTQV